MFCPNCGTRYDEGDRFCAECGNRLGVTERNVDEPSAEVYTAPQDQTGTAQFETKASNEMEEQSSFVKKLMSYDLPEDTCLKLPFPSFVLKFIRIGIWTLYFFSIFFGWVFFRISGWGAVESDSRNILQIIFNAKNNLGEVKGWGVMVFLGILVLLVLTAISAVQSLNIFIPEKLPVLFSKIPQIVLCAAPAAIAFVFMIAAWIIMAQVAKMSGFGIDVSAGPGFGAWLVFILSGIETAAFFLFVKGKKESVFKA